MAVEDAPSYAELQQRLAQTERELAEARERETEGLARETATGEILWVIAGSPTEPQPVLDTIVESATRLCDGTGAVIYRFDGTILRVAASTGSMQTLARGEAHPVTRGSVIGQAILEHRTVHVH